MKLITTIDDVKNFFKQLHEDGLNFHPDTPFEDYIYIASGDSLFNADIAQRLNELLQQCFVICQQSKVDIYELTLTAKTQS